MYTIKMDAESLKCFKEFQRDGESSEDSIIRLLDTLEENMDDIVLDSKVSNIAVSEESLNRLKSLKLRKREALQDVITRLINVYDE